ncbi:nucleotide exchange factor GrpE [Flavobacterium agricola]|uniref:Protein GrpE n=1 Tax=Flavobacterium agricola TaxID=2870839 RepID=A0ABY6LWG9_9FLAO|nr:nucleotide exchange factor GrpE [Flavobacterium agricola]UYW00302.1 nucleotide exchange factor GrpE [Flavobacterium agricola]
MSQDITGNIENEELQNENVQENATNTDEVLSAEEKLTQELAAEKDRFLRLFAEFENYKKRTSKERLELMKTANQEVLQALLPVVDDFDRALPQISKSEGENLVKGVELIFDKLKATLKSKGLEEVELKAGDVFDADIAEAITQTPAGDKLKGKVVDVIEKGYKLGDKIIRFPKVVVGQ